MVVGRAPPGGLSCWRPAGVLRAAVTSMARMSCPPALGIGSSDISPRSGWLSNQKMCLKNLFGSCCKFCRMNYCNVIQPALPTLALQGRAGDISSIPWPRRGVPGTHPRVHQVQGSPGLPGASSGA